MRFPTVRAPGLWLTLLASSSASGTYVQYASGASFWPPRYPLKAKWYQFVKLALFCLIRQFKSGAESLDLNGAAILPQKSHPYCVCEGKCGKNRSYQ
jgi:hypothetical protein